MFRVGDSCTCDDCGRVHQLLADDQMKSSEFNGQRAVQLCLLAAMNETLRELALSYACDIELRKVQARAEAEREGVKVAMFDRLLMQLEKRAKIDVAPWPPALDPASTTPPGPETKTRYRMLDPCAQGVHDVAGEPGPCARLVATAGPKGVSLIDWYCICCCHQDGRVPAEQVYHYGGGLVISCPHRAQV